MVNWQRKLFQAGQLLFVGWGDRIRAGAPTKPSRTQWPPCCDCFLATPAHLTAAVPESLFLAHSLSWDGKWWPVYKQAGQAPSWPGWWAGILSLLWHGAVHWGWCLNELAWECALPITMGGHSVSLSPRGTVGKEREARAYRGRDDWSTFFETVYCLWVSCTPLCFVQGDPSAIAQKYKYLMWSLTGVWGNLDSKIRDNRQLFLLVKSRLVVLVPIDTPYRTERFTFILNSSSRLV